MNLLELLIVLVLGSGGIILLVEPTIQKNNYDLSYQTIKILVGSLLLVLALVFAFNSMMIPLEPLSPTN